jgi:hypothetical protein
MGIGDGCEGAGRKAGARTAVAARVCCLVLLLTSGIVAFPARPAVAQASAPSGDVTLEGTFRILAVTPLPGRTLARHDIPVLEVGDRQYELDSTGQDQPVIGSYVRLSGRLSGRIGDLGMEIVEVSALQTVAGRAASTAAKVPPTTGTNRVLVMLVHWSTPDSVTPASANTHLFTADNDWFREVSYGQLGLTGSVTDWMSIPPPSTPCNLSEIMTRARAAAAGAGFAVADFDHTMAYFPLSHDCDFGGSAFVGDDRIWVNGSMTMRVTVHELGHNLGLNHSHKYNCYDGASNHVMLADQTLCSVGEYGDVFDVMGGGDHPGHFNAYQKHVLGWLGGTQIATLASAGSVTLPPIETASPGPIVARIDVTATRSYWIEYRQAIGFDSTLPPGGLDGVLVHLYDANVTGSLPAPLLLDYRPGPTSDFADAALPFNTTWQTPDNWRISIGSPSAGGVSVTATLLHNDAFAAATILGGTDVTVTGTTAAATKEAGEPSHAGNPGGRSVWYRWTAPSANVFDIDTAGSPFNTLLGVYTGSAVNALTAITSNDDAGGGTTTSRVTLSAVAGTTYRIAVDGFGGAAGGFTLRVAYVSPPANDWFYRAQEMAVPDGSTSPVRSANATKESGEPNHAGNAGGRSVWYSWSAPSTGTATFDTAGSNFNTLLGVYTGDIVNALTTIAFNDDAGAGVTTSRVSLPVQPGTRYRIAVDGSGGAFGDVTLSVAFVERPGNDDFANAELIWRTDPPPVSASTATATKEAGEPSHAGQPGGRSVWFRWKAPVGGTVTVHTSGSTFNTVLGVYSGSAVGALTAVASNDDAGPGDTTSRVSFAVTAGVIYSIAVDGFAGASGDATLAVEPRAPATNDDLTAARTISGDQGSAVPVLTADATKEPGEPNHAAVVGGKSVWYRWRAPGTGNVQVQTAGSSYDTLLAVYTGDTVGALSPVASNDNGLPNGASALTFAATTGTTYQIVIDGRAGASGTARLSWGMWTTPAPPPHNAFAAPQAVSGIRGHTTPATNAGASAEGGEPRHAGLIGGRSVWYRWTPTVGGLATIDTAGSTFDTVLAVYTGSFIATLSPVGANDDGGDALTSRLTFVATAGTTYTIAVDGFGSATGWIALRWSIGIVPADFDGDAGTDVSLFRPSTGQWLTSDGLNVYFGTDGDIPVPCDYDGDGATDVAVFRPSVGGWYVNGRAPVFHGLSGDIPVPGDYNGDGRCDMAVFRPAVGGWYIRDQSAVFYGLGGDIPVPADYDGDGRTAVTVFRPSVGGWYRNGAATVFFGLAGDVPVPGDYNGDGVTEVAVYRPPVGGWHVFGRPTQYLGLNGDMPQPGDYGGDGTTDLAVYRPSTGTWFIGTDAPVHFGTPGDIPVPLPSAIRQAL